MWPSRPGGGESAVSRHSEGPSWRAAGVLGVVVVGICFCSCRYRPCRHFCNLTYDLAPRELKQHAGNKPPMTSSANDSLTTLRLGGFRRRTLCTALTCPRMASWSANICSAFSRRTVRGRENEAIHPGVKRLAKAGVIGRYLGEAEIRVRACRASTGVFLSKSPMAEVLTLERAVHTKQRGTRHESS